MFRMNTYNEGTMYTLIPVGRQSVVPGQSLSVEAQASWESAAFNRNVLSGGLGAIMSFYVPYRLIWDEWVDFISDPESTAVVPTTATPWPLLFEAGASATLPVNSFARRAFKLIYNQYFGSDQYNETFSWYADVTADSDVSGRRLRTKDQFVGRLFPTSEAGDTVYEAPVTGTAPNQIASIPLNQFRVRMRDARSNRRADLTGDKYVDAMRRMGVQLDWRIQQAPEYLGGKQYEFEAKETRASYTPADPAPAGSAVTGRAYARFSERWTLKTPRRFFAEHGIVLTVIAIRPTSFPDKLFATQDAYAKTRDSFFLGDNQEGAAGVVKESLGATGGENYFSPRFAYLRAGQDIIGAQSGTPWCLNNNGTDVEAWIWPQVTVPQDSVLGNEMAVYTRYAGTGPTPVKAITF